MSISLTVHLDSIVLKEKPTAQSDIGALKKRLHKHSQTLSLEQLAHEHCINGKAYSSSIGDGTADGTTEQQVIVLDFDNKASNNKDPLPFDEQIQPADVEKRLAHVNLKPAFIGFSPSHIQNEWERFRVYIALDYPLIDKAQIIKARDALGNLFPEADPQAGKLGQFFFGSTKGLYKPVQNVTNAPQILFDLAEEHEAREKEYRTTIAPNTEKKGTHSALESIAELAQKIPMQEAIQAYYSNCSFRQHGNKVNVINHDYGNTSSFFIYEDSNSFCHYARTGNSGKTLGGGVMTFLIEVAKLEPKDAALWVENYLGVSEERKRAFLEDQKREQYTANRFYDEQLGTHVNIAADVPPQPVIPDTPLPLRRPPQEQAPYPVDALGEFAEVVNVIAEHVAAPVPMVAASALAVLSLCTQRLANVEHEGRSVFLSLYFLTIAGSGDRKSTVDDLITAAIREYEGKQFQAYNEDLRAWGIEMRAHEVAKKHIEKGKDVASIKQGLLDLGTPPEKPISPRMLFSNVNVEGLYRLYQEGVHSLGLFSDEAGTFFGGTSFANENKLKSISFFASLWSSGRADKVRMIEGDSHITNKRLAAHLMLQPIIAEGLLADELLQQQGFFPRFLMTASKSLKGTRLKDGTPTRDITQHKAVRSFHATCRALLALDPQTDEHGTPLFKKLRLSAEAEHIYRELYNETEKEQAESGKLAHVSNYASRCAEQALRMAGVLTITKDPTAKNIDGDTMLHGAHLALWYLAEATRLIEDSGVSMEIVRAEKLLKWLETHGEKFVTTQKMAQYTRLKDTKEIKEALKLLQEHGYVKQAPKGILVDGKVSNTAWEVVTC